MSYLNQRFQAAALAVTMMISLSGAVALANHHEANADGKPPAKKECRCQHHGGKKKSAMMKRLNLTEAQKEQLKTQKAAFKQENAAAIESLKAKRQELRKLGKDPANAEAKAKLKESLKQEAKALMEKKAVMFQSVLTPEQQAEWETIKQERRQKWEQKKQKKQQSAT